MSMEIVKSKRGNDVLLFNGYKFNYNKRNDGKVYWRCATRGCKATCLSVGTGLMLKEPGDHNHPPLSPSTLRSFSIISSMRERIAEDPNRPVQHIYSDVLSQAISTSLDEAESLEVAASMPAFQSIRSTLYRERKKQTPPLPKTRSEIQLPDEFKTTIDGRVFLQADNGEEDKILVFATDSALERLSASETVYMNSSVSTCPQLFHQMSTLLVEAYGKIFPVVFSFLPDKSSATYQRLFKIIKGRIESLGLLFVPAKILIDFEQAVNIVAREEFPHARLCGSLFHYSQSLWWKIEALEGVDEYQKSAETRQYIKRCAALAFVPLHELDNSWPYLQGLAPQNQLCSAFTEYFDQTWMDDIVSRFPRTMWNQFENMGEESMKANSLLESWHRSLNGIVSPAHPNVFRTLISLRKEQEKIEAEMRSLRPDADAGRAKKKGVRKVTQTLENLRDEYLRGERTVIELIDSSAYTIHF